MAFITYPLNNIDYTAEDAELFHCTRTSGVWAKNSFPLSVTGADNKITVGKGIAWINNKEFSGKVVALKSAQILDLGLADGTYPRIDVIAIQFNANNNETDIVVKKGTPTTKPVRPAIIRTEAIYELYLASIYRSAGSTVITAGNITDLRMDQTVCGLMADSVTQVDMTAIEAQIRAFINTLQNEINAVRDMSGLMLESEWVDGNVIPLEKGGTGKSAHTSNAVLTGNGTKPVNNVPTKNGAFYATEENDEPRFGILPVGQGGTGARNSTDARKALGIGSVATENTLPISKGGTGATTASVARTNLGLDGKLFTQHALNSINIDSTSGNWTVDISEIGHGAVPMPWVNVTQTTGAHFIVQIAIKCDTSQSTSGRDQRMWIRDKYSSGVWSNWKEILTTNSNVLWTKVWGNGNSGSAFGGQDITNVTYGDEHNLFLCVFKSAHDAQKEFSVIARKNEESEIHIIANIHNNGDLKVYARRFKINTGYQRVTFYDCSVKTIGKDAVSTDSSKLIPVAIYACKG